MRTNAIFSTVAFAVAATLATACASGEPAAGPTASPAGADTVSGTLAVVGADPLARPAVRPGDGGPEIFLTGPAAENAAALQGMEVWARGRLDAEGRELEVERLEVRGIDGTAAIQGTLTREGARWHLALDDGRRVPLRNIPRALQEEEGERVWIAAPVDVSGGSFGTVP